MGNLDFNKFLISSIKARERNINRDIYIQPDKFLDIIKNAVDSNNPSYIPNFFDNEIFNRVFSHCKKQYDLEHKTNPSFY